MFIKRYLVKSMPEAVDQIKQDLGPDAVILSSHKVRAKGIAGFFGRTLYEVIAAVDEDKQVAKKKTAPTKDMSPGYTKESVLMNVQKSIAQSAVAKMDVPKTPEEPKVRRWEPEVVVSRKKESSQSLTPLPPADIKSIPKPAPDTVANELKELRSMLTQFMMDGSSGVTRYPDLKNMTSIWAGTGLSQELIEKFIHRLQSSQTSNLDVSQTLILTIKEFIHDILSSTGALRLIGEKDKYVALVGPTGVGKTTTIAKMAAQLKLKEGRNVGLLTVDTFRVAAVEQLRTYADILNVPFAIAESAKEVSQALEQLEHCDLILIDTTGRGFLDQDQVTELKAFLELIPIDLTYMVLSLTARPAEAFRVADMLQELGCQSLLFTKADEAILPSLALTVSNALKLPLSYISGGQHVPSDLFVAEPSWFIERYAGGEAGARSS